MKDYLLTPLAFPNGSITHSPLHTVLSALMRNTKNQAQCEPTWEKVPHDSIVHESASDGNKRCRARPQAIGRAPTMCMHIQLSLVHILFLLTADQPFLLWSHVHNMQNGYAGEIHGNSTYGAC